MENEILTEKVLIKKEKLSLSFEQLVENDLSLPDYCPDIVKVLGCTSQVNIFSATATGDKLVVDGCVILRTAYSDAKNMLRIVECTCPLNRSADIKNPDEKDIADIECTATRVNARAVNPRRLEIRGGVTMNLRVSCAEEFSFITEIPEKLCHSLRHTYEGNFLSGSEITCMSVKGSSEPDEKLSGAFISHTMAMPVITETKTIKGKMMLRGSISVTVQYLSPEGNPGSVRLTLPVNQISEAYGADEESICCSHIKIRGIEARITPDSPQSPSCIEVTVNAAAYTDFYQKRTVRTVSQAYSPFYEMICRNDILENVSSLQQISDNHTCVTGFDFSGRSIKRICDTTVKKISHSSFHENDSLAVRGNISFSLTLEDENGEKHYFERIADFEYKKQLPGAYDNPRCDTDAFVNAIHTELSRDGVVTITTELHLDSTVSGCTKTSVMTHAQKGAAVEKCCEGCMLTVYFARKGELLWDIAKAHRSSEKIIRDINKIDCDVLENDCMLIIEQE